MKKILKNKMLIFFISALLLMIVLNVLMSFKIINRYYTGLIITVLINIVLVTSLNLTSGYLGQLTLGHAGFMAVGAYTSAFLTTSMDLSVLGFYGSLLVAGIVSMVFGLLIGIPSLRLKGDYLAIITLGFGEVIKTILLSLNIVGGAKGMMGIARYTNFNNAYIVMLITVILIVFLRYSTYGRSMLAIREDEIASESCGINLVKYKLLAFVFAAFFAGIAGGLYAHYVGIIEPNTFDFNKSIEILVMVVLGGMGNIKGGIIAAIVLTLIPEMLREFSDYRTLIYAIVLIGIMLYRYDPRIQKKVNEIKAKIVKRGEKYECSRG